MLTVRQSRRLTPLRLAALFALGGCATVFAQGSSFPDPIAEIHLGYETWVDHAFGPFAERSFLRLRATAPPAHIVLSSLPAGADIDAWEWIGPNLAWFSLADWAVLPGDLRVHPGDIVQWNGTGFAKIFDLLACGGAPGLNLDALDANPGLFGGTILLVSFDTNQTFFASGNPFTVFDEEMISLVPQSCSLGASAIQVAGSERRWDLDGLGIISRWGLLLDSQLYLSYDTWIAPAGSGIVGGPGDVISHRFFTSTWTAPLHGTYGGTIPARELDAVWVLEAGLFEDGFEIGTTGRWSATGS